MRVAKQPEMASAGTAAMGLRETSRERRGGHMGPGGRGHSRSRLLASTRISSLARLGRWEGGKEGREQPERSRLLTESPSSHTCAVVSIGQIGAI